MAYKIEDFKDEIKAFIEIKIKLGMIEFSHDPETNRVIVDMDSVVGNAQNIISLLELSDETDPDLIPDSLLTQVVHMIWEQLSATVLYKVVPC